MGQKVYNCGVKDLIGTVMALSVVRMFWTAVMKWHDFYERYLRHPLRPHPEVPQSPASDALQGG